MVSFDHYSLLLVLTLLSTETPLARVVVKEKSTTIYGIISDDILKRHHREGIKDSLVEYDCIAMEAD